DRHLNFLRRFHWTDPIVVVKIIDAEYDPLVTLHTRVKIAQEIKPRARRAAVNSGIREIDLLGLRPLLRQVGADGFCAAVSDDQDLLSPVCPPLALRTNLALVVSGRGFRICDAEIESAAEYNRVQQQQQATPYRQSDRTPA